MNYKVFIRKQASENMSWFRKNEKQSYVKCLDLLLSIVDTPRDGIGQPERLKHFEEEVYSPRINKKDRMVYVITSSSVFLTVRGIIRIKNIFHSPRPS